MKLAMPVVGDAPGLRALITLEAQLQRPAQSANLGGTFELGWGTALLLFGLVPYFNAVLPKSIWTSAWTAWLGYLPLLCGAFAPYAVPRIVRRFIIWPRAGYVATRNELKLVQLVRIMIFGLALGRSLGLLFVVASELRDAIGHPGRLAGMDGLVRQCVELLVCAVLAVYLGRKVVSKPPSARVDVDAALIKQRLEQSVDGRICLRRIKHTLLLILAGVPILVCAVVLGFGYLSKVLIWRLEVDGAVLVFSSLLAGGNGVLYLMSNGAGMMKHRWKWLVLAGLLIVPVAVGPVMPHPAPATTVLPIVGQIPPVILCISVFWVLSGVASLVGFIRHTPLPQGEPV